MRSRKGELIMFYGLQILPSRSEDRPRFRLSAALQGLGGPVPAADWQTWDKLAAALGSVRTDVELIDEARKKALEKGEAVTIPNMSLTDKQLRRLGFMRE
jgi:hypothetical protein